jgi:hypothetical protein
MRDVNGKEPSLSTPDGAYTLTPVDAPPLPPAPRPWYTRWIGSHDSAWLRAAGIALTVLSMLCAFGFALCGCSAATTARVTRTALVATGTATAQLAQASRDAYVAKTDLLVADIRAHHGDFAEYLRRVDALDVELKRRTDALAALDAALYACAAVVDLGRGATPETLRAAVADVLTAFDVVTVAMADGAVLPAIAIPAPLRATIATLRRMLAPPAADAGAEAAYGPG